MKSQNVKTGSTNTTVGLHMLNVVRQKLKVPVSTLLPTHSLRMFKNPEVLSISLSFTVQERQICREASFSFWEENLDYNKQFLVGAFRARKLFLAAVAEAGACSTASCDRQGGLG